MQVGLEGFVLLLATSGEPDAVYTLALLTEPRLRVEASVAIRGDEDGSSAFSAAAMWGGLENAARYLHDVEFFADGAPVAAEHPLETAWVVAHAPGAALKARWYLDPIDEAREKPLAAALGNDYRPTLRPGLFHLIGNTGLLTPDSLKSDAWNAVSRDDDQKENESKKEDGSTEESGQKDATPPRIRLEWKGFAEAGWKVASSYGNDPAGTTVEVPIEAFTHAVFLAGELELHSREMNGTRLLFALHARDSRRPDPEHFGFKGEELADLGARIIQAERDFFSDWSEPLFVVTLVPDLRTDRTSIGGTGLTHSFALFLSRGTGFRPATGDTLPVAMLLAHEHFHHWNGGKLRLEEPEQLGYWLSEGFTDFFARRILLRAGLIEPAEYVRRLNDSLAGYWQNPRRREPNARIVADFWKDQRVGELPYRRGDLVAMLLDHEIRTLTAGSDRPQSLDDFFRDVLARARERDEPASTDNLLELVADWTSQEFADRLRALIVDGAEPDLAPDLGAPFLRLTTRKGAAGAVEIPCFEFVSGADLEAARGGM